MLTAAQLMVRIGADVSGLDKGLSQADKKVSSFGSKITKVAGLATAALGVGLVAGIAKSVSAAADFEGTLNMLQAVTGATGDEMAALSKKAKDLGSDMSLPATSAADAATAMTELAKAGLSVNDTMAASKGVLQLSAAGQISNAEAAKVTAAALNAFKLEGSQATRVADLLAAASNASAAEVGDLAQGLQQGAFAFSASGQSVESLVASLAILTNVGLTGSDAGTALKNAIVRLMAPTDEASNLMKSLGINVYDTQGKMLPLRDIIGVLNTQMAGMTQQERNAALATIFLSDGMKAMIPLLDAGVPGFDKITEAVTKQGAAADLAAARTKGFLGALEGFKSQAETLAILVGSTLLPALTGIATAAANGLAWLMEQDWSAAKANLDSLGQKFNEVAGWVRDTAIPALLAFKKELDPEVGLAAANMATRFSEAFASITRSSQEGADGTVAAQNQGMEDLKNLTRLSLNIVQEDWAGAYNNIREISLNGWRTIIADTKEQSDFNFDPKRILDSPIARLAEAAYTGMKGVAGRAAAGLADGIDAQLGYLKGKWQGFLNSVGIPTGPSSASLGFGPDWREGGKAIVEGIGQGIGDSSAANNALAGLDADLINQMNSDWEIHSPSKVTERMGQDVMQGLINGLGSRAGDLDAIMRSVADSLTNQQFFERSVNGVNYSLTSFGALMQELTHEYGPDFANMIREMANGTAALGSVATGTAQSFDLLNASTGESEVRQQATIYAFIDTAAAAGRTNQAIDAMAQSMWESIGRGQEFDAALGRGIQTLGLNEMAIVRARDAYVRSYVPGAALATGATDALAESVGNLSQTLGTQLNSASDIAINNFIDIAQAAGRSTDAVGYFVKQLAGAKGNAGEFASVMGRAQDTLGVGGSVGGGSQSTAMRGGGQRDIGGDWYPIATVSGGPGMPVTTTYHDPRADPNSGLSWGNQASSSLGNYLQWELGNAARKNGPTWAKTVEDTITVFNQQARAGGKSVDVTRDWNRKLIASASNVDDFKSTLVKGAAALNIHAAAGAQAAQTLSSASSDFAGSAAQASHSMTTAYGDLGTTMGAGAHQFGKNLGKFTEVLDQYGKNIGHVMSSSAGNGAMWAFNSSGPVGVGNNSNLYGGPDAPGNEAPPMSGSLADFLRGRGEYPGEVYERLRIEAQQAQMASTMSNLNAKLQAGTIRIGGESANAPSNWSTWSAGLRSQSYKAGQEVAQLFYDWMEGLGKFMHPADQGRQLQSFYDNQNRIPFGMMGRGDAAGAGGGAGGDNRQIIIQISGDPATIRQTVGEVLDEHLGIGAHSFGAGVR